ncbi:MAG TPA: hypothetical protein VFA28_04345 [Bryobacteraceae bacterium]|nr:hypothetical protein [Bryobacteraceae bacterium]
MRSRKAASVSGGACSEVIFGSTALLVWEKAKNDANQQRMIRILYITGDKAVGLTATFY